MTKAIRKTKVVRISERNMATIKFYMNEGQTINDVLREALLHLEKQNNRHFARHRDLLRRTNATTRRKHPSPQLKEIKKP